MEQTIEERMARLVKEVEELKLRIAVLESKLTNACDWPAGLPMTTKLRRAFDALRREGFLRIDTEGHVVWCGSCDTSLAFACGLLWGGDRVRKGLWCKGRKEFPGTMLDKYFSVKQLRKKRDARINTYLSEEESMIYEILAPI